MTPLILSPVPLPLGESGFSVSPLAWGMWRLAGDAAETCAKIAAAREIGITLFDTADIYGASGPGGFGSAEALFGAALKREPGWRKEMVIATKGGIHPGTPYNSGAAYLSAACEASLKRLGIERIDLYQIHRPDLLAHPREVAECLARLHRDGKIASVGVSNYTAAQTRALQRWLDLPIVAHQPEFSVLHLDPLADGVIDLALERNMAVLAWSPLGGGRLAGKAGPIAEALDALARREGVSRLCLALAWIMAHPARPIPIIGSQSPAHIRQCADVYKVRLSREDWYGILAAARGAALP